MAAGLPPKQAEQPAIATTPRVSTTRPNPTNTFRIDMFVLLNNSLNFQYSNHRSANKAELLRIDKMRILTNQRSTFSLRKTAASNSSRPLR